MATTPTPTPEHPRHAAADLTRLAGALLRKAGMTGEQAAAVAQILVEGDLMGHTTHGLQLLGPYLRDLQSGAMRSEGRPEVLADQPAAFTWDGRFLPGPWLVREAMGQLFERIEHTPVATAVIRRSHHIACLAAYLKAATDRNLLMLLTCSDPSGGSVAPFGAHAGRYTPNPIAAGIPTDGLPILIDISASTTTNGMVARLHRAGGDARLPAPWLLDNQGRATDDPAAMFADPPGAILPLGGLELGYKGFALGLLVEALTSSLAGYGRADDEKGWGAAVFIQLIDPQGFGGQAAFRRESGWLAQACRTAPVMPGQPAVRLPGERALALREEQLKKGVALHPETWQALAELALRHHEALPGQAG